MLSTNKHTQTEKQRVEVCLKVNGLEVEWLILMSWRAQADSEWQIIYWFTVHGNFDREHYNKVKAALKYVFSSNIQALYNTTSVNIKQLRKEIVKK